MELLKVIFGFVKPGLPLFLAMVIGFPALAGMRKVLDNRYEGQTDKGIRIQLLMLLFSFVLLVLVVIVSPISDNQKGQILSLVGIVVSAAIALSSTTFIGNIMAGLMLRAVKGFRVGDFISIGDDFGRVSERGLFHIEIQTELRDLITLPNLHLVSHPVKVIRSSGTIITSEVTLGYDLPRTRVREALLRAGEKAELKEPFVHVANLGDFSVTYRVSGLLTETKQLISVRSRLRECMLDELHMAGIEIVSPNFMNTRQLAADLKVIPKAMREAKADPDAIAPENIVFDKADEAESLEQLRFRLSDMKAEIETLESSLGKAADEQEKSRIEARIASLQTSCEVLGSRLESEMEDD